MPDKFSQLGFTEEKAAPTEDFKSLGFAPTATAPGFIQRGIVDPTGGLIGQLRHPLDALTGLAKGAAMAPVRAGEIGVGAGQELQRLGLNIPGVRPGLAKLASLFAGRQIPTTAVQPTPVISTKTAPGAIGKAIGDITAFGAPIGGAEALGLGALGRVGAGIGTGAALAPPGQRITGAAGVGAAALAPEVAGGLLKTLPKMDVVLRSRLGQRVINAVQREKDILAPEYAKAFKGTEGITPQLGKDTISNLAELKTAFPGTRGTVPKALERYFGKIDKDGNIIKKPNKTLENLHLMRSDLGKEWNRLEIKRTSPVKLTTSEGEDQALLSETRKNLSKSLENNFKAINPENKAHYDLAQKRFENRVAPFEQKGHTAIMKALSPDREFTNKLFTEIGADSVKASKVRNVLGVSRPQLEIAKLLRSKLVTFPAIGAGLFLGGRKFL
ncbi:MAG: hypothetical protein ACYSYU_05055 [Planctomycetota bacterium]|jgi:hypothetical protein